MTRLCSTFKVLLLSLTLLFQSQLAYAQISVTTTQNISYGSFTFVDMANVLEITIDTDDNVTNTSNVALITVPKSGQYTLTGGNPLTAFNVSTDSSVTLSGDGPGTFVIDDIVVEPSTSIFDAFGDADISLGGRLRSSGGGVQYGNGGYSGTLNITVSY